MKLGHSAVNFIGNIVNDAEYMNIDGVALTNAYSAANGLVNNCGIPVLTEKQDAATEL